LSISTTSFRDSVRHIERGSKVLVAYADADGGDDVKDLGLVHAACLAIIERSALVTTAFTVVGKQILRVKEPYRGRVDSEDGTPPTIAQLLGTEDAEEGAKPYWSKWQSDYDYVYVLFTDTDYENPDPERLSAIYAGERFVLYRIIPPNGTKDGDTPRVPDNDTPVVSERLDGTRLVDTSDPLPPE
jgi:hypothetical protein